MDVTDFSVNCDNFKMAIVNEGEIIANMEPDSSRRWDCMISTPPSRSSSQAKVWALHLR